MSVYSDGRTDEDGRYIDIEGYLMIDGKQYGMCNVCGEEVEKDTEHCEDGEVVSF